MPTYLYKAIKLKRAVQRERGRSLVSVTCQDEPCGSDSPLIGLPRTGPAFLPSSPPSAVAPSSFLRKICSQERHHHPITSTFSTASTPHHSRRADRSRRVPPCPLSRGLRRRPICFHPRPSTLLHLLPPSTQPHSSSPGTSRASRISRISPSVSHSSTPNATRLIPALHHPRS